MREGGRGWSGPRPVVYMKLAFEYTKIKSKHTLLTLRNTPDYCDTSNVNIRMLSNETLRDVTFLVVLIDFVNNDYINKGNYF